ncbi:ArsR/SmtB family transcription factor [Kutzneria sp. NPDC052558]|uniref:ArsR/SmtB family transcription factor n=1 Tax=Kutzneria sp. NPDC052558 TaxID=3364121 RepID=UPI0037C59AE3
MKHADAIAELSRQLAHPLRVTLLGYVAEHGPCAFSELVEAAGAAQAQVGNHLSLLRKAGLLVTERQGRQSLYRLPNAHLAEALANLAAAAGVPTEAEAAVARTEVARACYDHIGGKLGVAVLAALRRQEILVGETDLVEGPAAELLAGFAAPVEESRRRFAYGCPDWTEHAPHLGGALGAAIADNFTRRQWIRRRAGSRVLDVTGKGRTALRELGVEI